MRIQQIAGAATAFLFAGLAPALVMAALWHTAVIAPIVFAFTFAIALGHAVLLGLPLFLVFRSKGWINVMSCVVFGFAVGAVPTGVLAWSMQHPELHTSTSVDGAPTIINWVTTAAEWISYVKPLIYFGLFGALGGFVFWVALIWSGTFGNAAAAFDRSLASRAELRHPVTEERPLAMAGQKAKRTCSMGCNDNAKEYDMTDELIAPSAPMEGGGAYNKNAKLR